MSPPGELAMFLALGLAALGLLFGPIGAAVARRIAGRPEGSETHAEIQEMGAQMTAEVDSLRNRLAEVEERLDFAERLLTQDAPVNQLPRGAQQ